MERIYGPYNEEELSTALEELSKENLEIVKIASFLGRLEEYNLEIGTLAELFIGMVDESCGSSVEDLLNEFAELTLSYQRSLYAFMIKITKEIPRD